VLEEETKKASNTEISGDSTWDRAPRRQRYPGAPARRWWALQRSTVGLGAMRMPLISRRTLLGLAGALVAPRLTAPVGAQSVRRATVANGRRYLQYDVFTDRPLTGNQLAVFLDTTGLGTETMAAMTRETNFSEATFVFPAERAGTDVRLRIFGRGGEMPFAGHPVIGSAFALADDGAIRAGTREFTFGLNIGPTLVELEWQGDRLAFAWMTQQPPVFGATLPAPDAVAAALGVPAAALRSGLPMQEVNCGSAFYFVPLATRAAVIRPMLDARHGRDLREGRAHQAGVSSSPPSRAQTEPPSTVACWEPRPRTRPPDPPAGRSAATSSGTSSSRWRKPGPSSAHRA
jgi:predicted PhzF superfamily epimerase YddE/YHI9